MFRRKPVSVSFTTFPLTNSGAFLYECVNILVTATLWSVNKPTKAVQTSKLLLLSRCVRYGTKSLTVRYQGKGNTTEPVQELVHVPKQTTETRH